MDSDVKQRWIAALRSREYPQTTGYLRDFIGYCCLGVLCDLYDPSEWTPKGNPSPGTDPYDFYDFKDSYTKLPAEVSEWAGLPDCDPEVTIACGECGDREGGCDDCFGEGETIVLSELNDYPRSFDRIADVIEEQL